MSLVKDIDLMVSTLDADEFVSIVDKENDPYRLMDYLRAAALCKNVNICAYLIRTRRVDARQLIFEFVTKARPCKYDTIWVLFIASDKIFSSYHREFLVESVSGIQFSYMLENVSKYVTCSIVPEYASNTFPSKKNPSMADILENNPHRAPYGLEECKGDKECDPHCNHKEPIDEDMLLLIHKQSIEFTFLYNSVDQANYDMPDDIQKDAAKTIKEHKYRSIGFGSITSPCNCKYLYQASKLPITITKNPHSNELHRKLWFSGITYMQDIIGDTANGHRLLNWVRICSNVNKMISYPYKYEEWHSEYLQVFIDAWYTNIDLQDITG